MDKLRAIETFIAIADHGSLTEAALRLERSLPAVVRNLAALETSVGVRLFNRTTRRLDLTEEGRLYLDHCRGLLADLAMAEERLHRTGGGLAGPLHVAAPVLFGEMHVAPLLLELAQAEPGLSMRLNLVDRIVDLLDGHFDLAVRIGHLADSSLKAQKVGEVRQVLCAAPALLARTGALCEPSELSKWPCLCCDGNRAGGVWPFRIAGSETAMNVRIKAAFTTNLVRPLLSLCAEGAGFGLFLNYQVAEYLRNGALVELLPEWQPAPLPVHLVHGYDRTLPPRVRTSLNLLRAGLTERIARLSHAPMADRH